MNQYKKFIKDAHKEVCGEWKTKIEEAFPELVESHKLKINTWYKWPNHGQAIMYITKLEGYGTYSFYGRNVDDEWVEKTEDWGRTDAIQATDKEVEEMLIKEAKKRFGDNVIQCLRNDNNDKGKLTENFDYWPSYNSLWNDRSGTNDRPTLKVFDSGKWATIIKQTKEMTVAEVSKQLGYEVKIVK